jgi:hypothetical protein
MENKQYKTACTNGLLDDENKDVRNMQKTRRNYFRVCKSVHPHTFKCINLLAPAFYIQILAHPVCKM